MFWGNGSQGFTKSVRSGMISNKRILNVNILRKNNSIKQNRAKVHKMTVASAQNHLPKKPAKFVFKALILGLLSFLLWYIWDYTRPSNFPVKHVKIFATYDHIEQKDLQKTIASYLDNGFFYLNVIGMKQRLLKYPWVYAVSVKREWPDTVAVNIIEQPAMLRWGTNSLINAEGTIFTPDIATFPQGLPVIFGPENREAEIFALYQKIQELLKSLDLTIKQLVLSSEHCWEVVLSSNTTVYLKEDEPLTQLELLVKLYKKITTNHNGSPISIDLRYKSGLAVKWG